MAEYTDTIEEADEKPATDYYIRINNTDIGQYAV